ncbi:MAG: hypothetical protein JSC188_001105 [Candidatus Tokpelaia sp. JSC188]|nr:MAG: hypothetical protein JSC188_001105 [Candidatus Tokpelaia sp. JSC188]
MHIEPGVVVGGKIFLSYATAIVSFGIAGEKAWKAIGNAYSFVAFCARSVVVTGLVLLFFEILPHYSAGISEVHFIFGSTLLLIFGEESVAFGFIFGLLIQGLFFAPFDLPQYGMNITTLLIPLYLVNYAAQSIISRKTPYRDVKYWQALTLSLLYQAGIVSWVGFWVAYGKAFNAVLLNDVLVFIFSYMSVIIIEPLIDLVILAVSRSWVRLSENSLVQYRFYHEGV